MRALWFGMVTALALGGCTTYVIDSNPRGLRASVNNVEAGLTPCRYTVWSDWRYPLEVTVAPPSNRQLQDYANAHRVDIHETIRSPQTKVLTPRSPSGTVFFEFVTSEFDADARR